MFMQDKHISPRYRLKEHVIKSALGVAMEVPLHTLLIAHKKTPTISIGGGSCILVWMGAQAYRVCAHEHMYVYVGKR